MFDFTYNVPSSKNSFLGGLKDFRPDPKSGVGKYVWAYSKKEKLGL